MKAVIQKEETGCGIASSAAIARVSYKAAKNVANSLGIHANDESLWSDTKYIRRLLNKLGYKTSRKATAFSDWGSLPDCALLSIKWHMKNGKPYWHWVVYVREDDLCYVLDSKSSLKNNIRTDFGRMKPKWYIGVIT